MLRKSLAIIACAASISSAHGEILLQNSSLNLPAGNLVQYTVYAVGTAGEQINVFAFLNLTGKLHQAHGYSFGLPIPTPDRDATLTLLQTAEITSEALAYDTRFLFGGDEVIAVPGERLAELPIDTSQSTTGTLDLPKVYGGDQPTGFSSLLSTPTGAYGLYPSVAGSNLAFLQVVLPASEQALLDILVVGNAGRTQRQFNDYVIGVPEPTTCVLACLALVGAAARRRV